MTIIKMLSSQVIRLIYLITESKLSVNLVKDKTFLIIDYYDDEKFLDWKNHYDNKKNH